MASFSKQSANNNFSTRILSGIVDAIKKSNTKARSFLVCKTGMSGSEKMKFSKNEPFQPKWGEHLKLLRSNSLPSGR